MKKSYKLVGSALVVGILTALPVYAGGGLIKVTHSDTPYTGGSQSGPTVVACAKATPSATSSTEVQVAVMAKSPVYAGPRRSLFIHR
jgi:hypothetical protein